MVRKASIFVVVVIIWFLSSPSLALQQKGIRKIQHRLRKVIDHPMRLLQFPLKDALESLQKEPATECSGGEMWV